MNEKSAARPILVGIDGSRFGIEALRWALAEAARRDCGVRALMVVHVGPIAAAGRPTPLGLAGILAEPIGQEHLRQLENTIRAVLGERDNPRLTAQIGRGSAPETLCAESAQAQLLVLGSHGRGAVLEAALGSVARYCAHHATCPVVVIPAVLAEPVPALARQREQPRQTEAFSYGFGPLL